MVIQCWIVKHQTSARTFLILNEIRYFCNGHWSIVSKNYRQRDIFFHAKSGLRMLCNIFPSILSLRAKIMKEKLEIVFYILHSDILNMALYVIPEISWLLWHGTIWSSIEAPHWSALKIKIFCKCIICINHNSQKSVFDTCSIVNHDGLLWMIWLKITRDLYVKSVFTIYMKFMRSLDFWEISRTSL